MLGLFKKFFNDPNRETIEIFEREIKIEYDSGFFLSLNVLSLTNTKLRNLVPLSVFTNVEILNLANNRIADISPLEALKHLRIVDLRFNQIKELPAWLHELDKPLYWSREDEEKEGIYLEGNPLSERTILRIKNRPTTLPKEKAIVALEEPKKERKEELEKQPDEPVKEPNILSQLAPLNTQHLVLFLPKENHSEIFDKIEVFNSNLQINLSVLEYDDSDRILNPKEQILNNVPYIIVILKDRECSLHPQLWESIFKEYASSKLFLIIEGEVKNIEEKMNFFKTYGKSNTLVEVFNGYDNKSNEEIIEKIHHHIEASQEVKSLWKREWILLKKEIELKAKEEISFEEFQLFADVYSISIDMREYIFNYLKRVGSIKEYAHLS